MDIFTMMELGNSPQLSPEEEELFMAASSDICNVSELQSLLAAGTSCRVFLNGMCSLHIAAKKGRCQALEILLAHDSAAVDFPADNGQTPLLWAAREGHSEIIRLLCEKGANINALTETGDSALHLAAWKGNIDAVRYLVDAMKCSPELRNKEGMKPVHFAVAGNHLETVDLLIGIDLNFKSSESSSAFGYSCLHRAAIYGSLEVMKRIVELDVVDPRSCAVNGSTILHLAAQNGRVIIQVAFHIHSFR